MTRRQSGRILGVALSALFASQATAQTRAKSPPRIDLSVSSGIAVGDDLGTADADLRSRSGSALRLFGTSSELSSAVPIEVRLGFTLTPRYTLEIRGGYARPELRTSITDDFEGAPALTVTERVDEYTIDGLLLIALRQRPRGVVPFLSAGAGFGWNVHEGLTLAEHGFSYRGGGGVKVPLSVGDRGWVRGVGVRADGGVAVFTGGLSLAEAASVRVVATGGVYLLF